MDELRPDNPAYPGPGEFQVPDEAFDDAVENDPTVHHKTTTALHSSVWIQGPGAVTLRAEANHDLLQVAALRGVPATKIEFVRLLVLRSAKTLLVWPTDDKDPRAVEVTWTASKSKFLASEVLLSAELAVESGRQNLYKVHVLKQSRVGPALAIDMRYGLKTKLVKRKSEAKSKDKGGQSDATPPSGEQQ